MSPLQRLRATRPRVLRRSEVPKTPEPLAQDEMDEPPSPPRQRFRLKRRVGSLPNTEPTQQFLERVAGADVPIPSIEEPVVYDDGMVDTLGFDGHTYPASDDGYPSEEGHFKRNSPPKTPAPSHTPALSPQRHHDWSVDSLSGIESSPEYESSRPSTARSTQTSASLFSHFSFTSEELGECISPEPVAQDRYDTYLRVEDAEKTVRASDRISVRRKAPWSRAMNQHLWNTYLAYLQDPKVTPIRISKNGMPPQGVLLRVSREARRTWKGTDAKPLSLEANGGSSTPVARIANSSHWPQTDAATRAHLRELCRANAGNTTRNVQYLAQSPTPFGKTAARRWSRHNTPAHSSVFSGNDMAVSLAVSTADSMQPQGPLAELTRSELSHDRLSQDLPPLLSAPLFTPTKSTANEIPRLGSPFVAKSYGPSSSSTLMADFGVEEQRQSQTVGHIYNLKSPSRINRPRSRSNTLRRRSRQTPAEARRTKRPSLASDMWSEPGASPVRPPSEPISRSLGSEISAPRSNIQELFEASSSIGRHISNDAPARLGSPFGSIPSSFSFPNRHSSGLSGLNQSASYRPFGSVQRLYTHAADQEDSAPPRSSLESRLTYLDERLKDFRHRDREWHPRRSESPF